MSQRKVFLDTDIGTDSDDAVALAYQLCQEQIDLLGVSTVGMDSGDRARIADAICDHLGQPEVPIAAGADRPLFPNPYWTDHHVDQKRILERWPARCSYAPNNALELMQKTILENPEEVALVTVGPLTNAALLAATAPEVFALLDSVWVMGGIFDYDPAQPELECNIILDPVAAGNVFHASYELDDSTRRAGFPPIHVVSLDTTRGLSLSAEEANEALGGEHLAPVLACNASRNEITESGGQGMHDPFTSMLTVRDDLCEFETGRVGITLIDRRPGCDVAFGGDERLGVTYFEPDENGPHYLAQREDREKVVEHLISTLQG